ncbi:50S ribosomal protein L25/general stress protein Ctc [Radicibacter daui]|uniref:50S ribosomal protein L25/general stress protein Ctc n=1 Tax=Radicibacter daui TaxID=3064829 RepID=UPI004046C410
MAKTVALSAQLREAAGKGAARRERREGRIPAVIYGDKQEPVSISFERVEFERKLDSHFFTHLFEITVGETVHTVVARDLQMDPVRDFPIHVDLLRVTGDAVVTINVPVEFLNADKAPGLKRGGVLNIVRHEVEMKALWNNIPEKVTVDLTGANVGDSIHFSAVVVPRGVTPTITDRDFTIATIAAPSALKSEENAEGGEAA